MKLQQKIVLISFIAVLTIGSMLAVSDSSTINTKDYLVYVGVVGFFAGLLQLVTGLFLLFLHDKRWAQGFLLSGGILMLVGFTTCTANFNLNIH